MTKWNNNSNKIETKLLKRFLPNACLPNIIISKELLIINFGIFFCKIELLNVEKKIPVGIPEILKQQD